MRATNKSNITTDKMILVNRSELQNCLSLGMISCDKLAEQADAVVRIGRRKLYNIGKVKAYIDSL